jgi:divalent metal cation (Fe/Co/Zn/Cd) transporter
MIFFDVMAKTSELGRSNLARRGRRLEYFTIFWSLLEGFVGIVAGLMAGSISLLAFGIDSFIEVTSGGAVLWRMRSDADLRRREKTEAIALRIVGVGFLALAIYVTYEAVADLLARDAPARSIAGIVLAAASVIVMPLLARAKGQVGRTMGSAAMIADGKQSLFCSYFSATLLLGLLLNAVFGLWWADPAAALVMVPLIAREGIEAVQGKSCCD